MSGPSCYEAAARKLGDRAMSVYELKQFLVRKGYPEEEIAAVIRDFLEAGYLNDSRFCMEYFRYAFGRNKGKSRAFAELRQKGVDSEVIQFAYEDYQEEEGAPDERERALAETEKILRVADLTWDDPIPDKIRGRVARKLNSYGYSSGLIYEILGEMKK